MRQKPNLMKILNLTGLLFGIIGSAIMFFWGPPQPDFSEESTIILEKSDPLWLADQRAKHAEYELMSRIGLVCLVVGFVSQFSAVFITGASYGTTNQEEW